MTGLLSLPPRHDRAALPIDVATHVAASRPAGRLTSGFYSGTIASGERAYARPNGVGFHEPSRSLSARASCASTSGSSPGTNSRSA